MEWLGNCWHQSVISTCSAPVITLPLACSRDSRPLTTQCAVLALGADVVPLRRGAARARAS